MSYNTRTVNHPHFTYIHYMGHVLKYYYMNLYLLGHLVGSSYILHLSPLMAANPQHYHFESVSRPTSPTPSCIGDVDTPVWLTEVSPRQQCNSDRLMCDTLLSSTLHSSYFSKVYTRGTHVCIFTFIPKNCQFY